MYCTAYLLLKCIQIQYFTYNFKLVVIVINVFCLPLIVYPVDLERLLTVKIDWEDAGKYYCSVEIDYKCSWCVLVSDSVKVNKELNVNGRSTEAGADGKDYSIPVIVTTNLSGADCSGRLLHWILCHRKHRIMLNDVGFCLTIWLCYKKFVNYFFPYKMTFSLPP